MDEPSDSSGKLYLQFHSVQILWLLCKSSTFAVETASPIVTQSDDFLAESVSICGHHLLLIAIKTLLQWFLSHTWDSWAAWSTWNQRGRCPQGYNNNDVWGWRVRQGWTGRQRQEEEEWWREGRSGQNHLWDGDLLVNGLEEVQTLLHQHPPRACHAVLRDCRVGCLSMKITWQSIAVMTTAAFFRSIDRVASSQLILDKTCLNDYGFAPDICDDLQHHDANNTVVQVYRKLILLCQSFHLSTSECSGPIWCLREHSRPSFPNRCIFLLRVMERHIRTQVASLSLLPCQVNNHLRNIVDLLIGWIELMDSVLSYRLVEGSAMLLNAHFMSWPKEFLLFSVNLPVALSGGYITYRLNMLTFRPKSSLT